jgi:hypothetical protein
MNDLQNKEIPQFVKDAIDLDKKSSKQILEWYSFSVKENFKKKPMTKFRFINKD